MAAWPDGWVGEVCEDDLDEPRRPIRRRALLPDGPLSDSSLVEAYRAAARGLDPDQRAAVEMPFGAVATISANAGSGKTTALVARMLRYAAEGNDAGATVAVSFTRVAAGKLRSRYEALTGEEAGPGTRRSRPWVGTCAGFGMGLLGRIFGLTRTPLSTSEGRRLLRDLPTFQATKPDMEEMEEALSDLCGRAELHTLVWPEFDGAGRLVRVHDVGAAATSRSSELRDRPEFRSQYAAANWFSATSIERRIKGEPPLSSREFREKVLARFVASSGLEPEDAVRLLVEHLSAKYQSGALDFSDMLYQPILLMVQHEHLRDRVRRRYRMFLADEAQDMSALDFTLLALAAGFPDLRQRWNGDRGLMMVGDSKQSLYWWRGGMPLVMDNLDRYLEFEPVSVGTLRYNYRSVAGIVAVSADYAKTFERRHLFDSVAVRPDNPNPIEIHRFPNTKQEDKALIARLRAMHADGAPWSDFVVLSRMNRDLLEIQAALIAAGIPFKMRSNSKLSDTKAFGFVSALLGLAANPRNVIAAATLALGLYGIGETSVAKMERVLRERLRDNSDLSIERALPLIAGTAAPALLNFTREVVSEAAAVHEGVGLGSALDQLHLALSERCCWKGEDSPIQSLIRMSLTRAEVARIIALVSDVTETLSEEGEFDELPPLRQLVEVCAALSLAEETDDSKGASTGLTLTTIHGMKGDEGRYVFGVHLTRRYKVSPRDADGERCAFYVLVTRPLDLLYLSSSEKVRGDRCFQFGVLNTNLADFTTRFSAWQRKARP